MESIPVECRSRKYDVVIGNELDDVLFELAADREVLVVTDSNVNAIYRDRIEYILPHAEIYVVRAGERSKSENVLFDVLEYMIDNDYDDRTVLVGIGGGVITDLVGFTASIFMRGIDYVLVPTTLVAQVDSSIGGKTGINLNGAKNAVGAFYQPIGVVTDIFYLRTLDGDEIKSGLGELIETSMIDEELFIYCENNIDKLFARDKETLIEAITKSVEIIAKLVSDDEREKKSISNKINVGQTIGHAMEMSQRFNQRTHGEYILMGIYFEAEIADELGRIEKPYKKRLQELIIKALGERPRLVSADRIASNTMRDKINSNGQISLIIPTDIGDSTEVLIDHEVFLNMLEKLE